MSSMCVRYVIGPLWLSTHLTLTTQLWPASITLLHYYIHCKKHMKFILYETNLSSFLFAQLSAFFVLAW